MQFFYKIFLATLFSLLCSISLFAAELKIVDNLGLVRIQKELVKTVSLKMKLSSDLNLDGIVRLVNLDGLAADVLPRRGAKPGIYYFDQVKAGQWQVICKDSKVRIESLKVVSK